MKCWQSAAQFAPLHGDDATDKVCTCHVALGIQSPAIVWSRNHLERLRSMVSTPSRSVAVRVNNVRRSLHKRLRRECHRTNIVTVAMELLPGVRQERLLTLALSLQQTQELRTDAALPLSASPDAGKRTGPYLTRLLLV